MTDKMNMSNEERAREIAQKKVGFFTHLLVYIIVIGFLAGLNFVLYFRHDRKYLWFFWPAAGWGIGVIFHFVGTFVTGGSWEDRIAQKELEKLNRKG